MDVKTYGEIELKLKQAIDHPIAPIMVNTSRAREVTLVGDGSTSTSCPFQCRRSMTADR